MTWAGQKRELHAQIDRALLGVGQGGGLVVLQVVGATYRIFNTVEALSHFKKQINRKV